MFIFKLVCLERFYKNYFNLTNFKFLLVSFLILIIRFNIGFCQPILQQNSASDIVIHDLIPAIYDKFSYIKNVAKLQFYTGRVLIKHENQTNWNIPFQQQTLINNDIIQTQSDGYAVLSFSTNNVILLKPNSTIGIAVLDNSRFIIRCYKTAMYVISFPPDNISIETIKGTIQLNKGECVVYADSRKVSLLCMQDKVKFNYNTKVFNQSYEINEGQYIIIFEYDQNINHSSKKIQSVPINNFEVSFEAKNWLRFAKFIEHFRNLHKRLSISLDYKIDNITINEKYLSHFESDNDGYWIIDSGNNPVPRVLSLKARIAPYPRPYDKFQLELDQDIIYVLRELPDGLYGVNFAVPTFPEFSLKIFYLCEQTKTKHKLFEAKFRLINKTNKIQEINNFFVLLKNEFERRNFINLRDFVSFDYRDMYGNNYVDFITSLESSLKKLRDIRISLYPRSYRFINNKEVSVQVNYRISALKNELGKGWNQRYEDLGVDLYTLIKDSGKWKIVSKQQGKFLQLIKVALDLTKGVVKGKVIDERTNQPIKDALVKILKTPFQTYTNANGEYIFYNVPPGRYDFEIIKNGYARLVVGNIEVLPVGKSAKS